MQQGQRGPDSQSLAPLGVQGLINPQAFMSYFEVINFPQTIVGKGLMFPPEVRCKRMVVDIWVFIFVN